MTRVALWTALALLALPAFGGMTVRVDGTVENAGNLKLQDGARLSAAALAAAPLPDAYLLGAAWLRPSLVTQQTRLKAGIVYDLAALHTQALIDGDVALASTASRMRGWITPLPVTGRRTAMLLAPRVVEATPSRNWPLAPGDALFYPARPTTVRVVGVVTRSCTVPFQPLSGARHYLASCTLAAGADPNWVWVIQPDGRTFRRGVALWNRSTTALSLAPGAIVYVPVAERATQTIDPDFNRDIVRFLATQVLPDGTLQQ